MQEIDRLNYALEEFKSLTDEKCELDSTAIVLKREISTAEDDAIAELYDRGTPGKNADERKASEIKAKQGSTRKLKMDLAVIEGSQASVEAKLSYLRNEIRAMHTIIDYKSAELLVLSAQRKKESF